MDNYLKKNCTSFISSNDTYDIILNCLRISLFSLYVLWLIFALCIKELRNKQTSFLINLSIVGIIICLSGFVLYFTNTCTFIKDTLCHINTIMSLFVGYYSGYAISVLTMYRMACVYCVNITKTLKLRTIIIIILVSWILPLVFTFINIYAFKSQVYYNLVLFVCVYNASGQYDSFIFFALFSTVLPSLFILVSYIMVLIKLRRLRIKMGSAVKKRLESPRITIQLVVYFLTFELSCVSTLVILYQTSLLIPIVSNNTLKILRLLRWFQHICPLGLLYFHPVFVKKYKLLINTYFCPKLSIPRVK